MKFITRSEEETRDLASSLTEHFKSGMTVCLNGEMGAGKTAFVKGVLKALNYEGQVTSPTFALCNHYAADIDVFHFDLYRIKDYDDLYSTGLFDIDEDSLVIIEWAEIALEHLHNFININFFYGNDSNERIIYIDKGILNDPK